MKKLILSFALLFSTALIFAQDAKTSKSESKLTPIEIQLSYGGIIPDIGINFYLKPTTLLRIDALKSNKYYSDSEDQQLTRRRVGAFLEMRKYRKNRGTYFSHGPSIGYEFSTGDDVFTGQELQVGYNLGFGYRITKHLTGGTYVSPYVGINEGGVDVLHGRLFVGALSNIYIAYRF